MAPILGAAIAGSSHLLITGIDRRFEEIAGEIRPQDLPPEAAR